MLQTAIRVLAMFRLRVPGLVLSCALLQAGYAILTGPEPVFAQEEDHPLITRYPGSTYGKRTHQKFDSYKLVIGFGEKGELLGKPLEGEVTRMTFNSPRDRSMLEVYKNYESALADAGMEVIFKCADGECGPGYASSRWNRFNGITTKSGSQCRYLAGKITQGDAVAYVSLMVGRRRHQIDIIEVKEMDAGMVTVDAEALGKGIDQKGFVAVYGIHFDTGKADVKPESKQALDEIARLLRERPDLKIHVVGHTDNVGEFQMNLRLSKARANAVTTALQRDYGIAASRLTAHGVGPLSPIASNSGANGRALNRRVELVAQ